MNELAQRLFRLVWAAERRLLALTSAPGAPSSRQPHRARTPRYPVVSAGPGDAEFGYGYLDRLRGSEVEAVSATDSGHSRLRVYSHSVPDTPPATHPHAVIAADNLLVDFSRVSQRDDLVHRPGYLRIRGGYSHYQPGALVAAGRPKTLSLDWLPRDHLRDIFGALTVADRLPAADVTIAETCLLVTREQREHTNLFHAHTDWLAAFTAVRLLGLEHERTRLVLLDRCPAGSLDGIFEALFSSAHGAARLEQFAGRRVLFRRAVFVAPGYSSLLWARQFADDAGPPVGLLRDYGRFVRGTFVDEAVTCAPDDPLRVTVLVRRPYGEGRAVLMRQFQSEDALVTAISGVPGVAVRVADPAGRPFADQLDMFAGTEVLVGAHGAGLSHTLAIAEHGALVEIVAEPASSTYRLYPNLAAWSGRLCRRITCPERYGLRGTWLAPDPDEVRAAVAELAPVVRERRPTRPRPS